MAVLFMKYTIHANVNPRHIVHQCCGDIVWHNDVLSVCEVCFVGLNILRCHVNFEREIYKLTHVYTIRWILNETLEAIFSKRFKSRSETGKTLLPKADSISNNKCNTNVDKNWMQSPKSNNLNTKINRNFTQKLLKL